MRPMIPNLSEPYWNRRRIVWAAVLLLFVAACYVFFVLDWPLGPNFLDYVKS